MKQDTFVADTKLILALERRSQPVLCTQDRILFRQGQDPSGLFILQSGEVVLTMRSDSGREVMSLHASAGSLLGLPGVIGNKPYTLTAVASKQSNLRFVARKDFEELLSADPSLYPEVLRLLATEVRTARYALSES